MPSQYQTFFDDGLQRQHAEVVARRANRIVHAEYVDGPGSNPCLRWLCVVATDQPGLLSQIASVVMANSLDIESARAYCRTTERGEVEAVDFFAVRSVRGPDVPVDVQPWSIASSIEALLTGKTSIDELSRRASPTSPPGARDVAPQPSVYFASEDQDLLIVESEDRRGLLLGVTLAMIREKVTIQSSNVTTIGRIARDEFLISEFDGSCLVPERRAAITKRVLGVVGS